MIHKRSPLKKLQRDLGENRVRPSEIARNLLARSNGSKSGNTYLWLDPAAVLQQATSLERQFPNTAKRPPLFGVPVSLKDCFDLAGTVTTCGSRFYAGRNGVAAQDSAVAERVKAAGALLVGKTHLHPLAYGITGQNAEYGDCLQSRDPGVLTGGSSSGAAASVQEGSAIAGIGTDTGGSIRVPAALCGLVGFRCTQARGTQVGAWPEMWRGAAHLAPSFDTLGLICADPRDAGELVAGLLGIERATVAGPCRVGWVPELFLGECDPAVVAAYAAWRTRLEHWGAHLTALDVAWWGESADIFARLQAHEAAQLHRGHFEEFEAGIAERLRWGASLDAVQVAAVRTRHRKFCGRMSEMMAGLDLIMLPCAPVSRLAARVDGGAVRQNILRYTTPISLAGMAGMALPGEMIGAGFGTGVQIAGMTDEGVLGWLELWGRMWGLEDTG